MQIAIVIGFSLLSTISLIASYNISTLGQLAPIPLNSSTPPATPATPDPPTPTRDPNANVDVIIVIFIAVVALAMVSPLMLDMILAYKKSNKSKSFETKEVVGMAGLYRTLMTFGLVLLVGMVVFYTLWLISGQLGDPNISPLVSLLSNLATILGTALATIIAFYFGIRGTASAVEKAAEAMIPYREDKSVLTITNTNPADGEILIPTNSLITATFNRPVSLPTINKNNFRVWKDDPNNPNTNELKGNITLSGDGKTAQFDPEPDLEPGTKYNVHIAAEAKDLAGNPLSPPKRWSFTTAPTGVQVSQQQQQQQQDQQSTIGPIPLNTGTASQNPSGPIPLSG